MRSVVAAFLLLAVVQGGAATYYIRSDGGSAEQCTGLSDAPVSGDGSQQACAWRHPFEALPPGRPARIAGGDTLVIAAGSYMMGAGAPGTETSKLCRNAPWDCRAGALPSGPAADRPTRVRGAAADHGCAHAPELWGTQHAAAVLDLRGSSNVELACLEITDHSSCIEFHNGTPRDACEREHMPYGPWAAVGIVAEDAANVNLRDVNIHGLAHDGIRAGRLRDWTLDRVRIVGNGWSGWNGDVGGNSSNAGKLIFRDVEIAWNGCAEQFPGGEHGGCWGQQRGGYGDGLGTAETGGDWLFERVAAHHNTQDGIDLLHANARATVTFRDVRAQANAGNQLKASGRVSVENSNVVGACSALMDNGLASDDACRARGNTLSIHVAAGAQARIMSNTIAGEGDCLIDIGCSEQSCRGSHVKIARNIMHGTQGKISSERLPCAVWADPNLHGAVLQFERNDVQATRGRRCPEGFTRCAARD
jgi:hypothetical protein